MAYSIRLPDGTLVQNIPDEVTPEAARAKILQSHPELGKTERSWGQAAGDIGASAISGLGALAQLPGQAYGLATGDFDTGILQGAKKLSKFGESLKSEGLTTREAQRAQKVAASEKDGQLSAFGTAFAETVKDPALMTSFLAEQVPQLFVPGSAAMGAGRMAFAKAVASGASETAAKAAAVAAGTAAAKGAGAVQQGADVGAQAYEDIYKRLIKDGKSKEEAAAQAIGLARATGASAAAISWLAQGLPGAQALEKALAGGATKSGIAKAFAAGAAGEGLSEAVEEGGGKFSQNLAMRDVDPTQALMQGVGATAGQAAVGGVGMGGGANAISSLRGTPEATAVAKAANTLTAQEQADEEKIAARAREQMTQAQGKAAREGEKLLAGEDATLAAQAAADSKARGDALAAQEAELRAKREADLQAAFPADYQDVMAGANAYAELFKEKQSLEGERKTKEVRDRIAQLDARMLEITEADTRVASAVAQLQKDQEKLAKAAGFPAKKSAKAMENAPAQMEMREALDVPTQPQTDLFGNPLQAAPDEAAPTAGDLLDGVPMTTQNLEDAGLGPTRKEMIAAGQRNLFQQRQPRGGKTSTPTQADTGLEQAVTTEEQPVTEPKKVEKPVALTPETVPTTVTPDVLGALGVGRTATIRKADHGIMGKDITDPAQAGEVKSILEAYKEGRSAPIQQKIDAYLARPEFQAAAPAAPTTTGETNARPVKQKGRGASVPTSVETDTGSAAPIVAESERAGMVPAGQDAGTDTGRKAKPAAPVNMFAQLVTPQAVSNNPEIAAEKATEKSTQEPEVPVHKKPWGGATLWGQDEADQTRKSEAVERVEGQSFDSLQAEIANDKSLLGAALRRAIASGKVIISDKHPSGERFGGFFDGNRVFLYADGIPAGQAMAVALHEVGVHMGLQKLLGKKQYDAIIERIKSIAQGKVATPDRMLAQAAIARIPKEDIARGADVTNDELLAYFIEETAKAEAAGTLPKFGPLRAAWTQVKNAIVSAINRALGTNLGVNDLTAQQITALAKGALFVESYTKAVEFVESGTGYMGRFSAPGALSDDAVTMLDNLIAENPRDAQPGIAEVTKTIANNLIDAKYRDEKITLGRQKAMDKYATILAKLSDSFSKGVRSTAGRINPEAYLRQADASTNLAIEFLRKGDLFIDKDTGLFRVKEGEASLSQALRLVNDFAKTNNVDFDKGMKLASKLLEGHRLFSLMEYNNELEQSAKILEGQGKIKEADAERGNKILLHHDIADIKRMEAEYQNNAQVKAIQDALNTTRASAIDAMVESGRITAEQGKFWKENASYVPFNRIFDEDVVHHVVRGKGVAALKNFPGLSGSLGRPVGNVIEAYAGRLSWMVQDAVKNYAAGKTLQAMEVANFAERVAKPEDAKVPAHVIKVYENGQPAFYEVQNKYDFEAFKQQPEIMSGLIKWFSGASRIFRTSITALPPFAIKQVVEDATRAMFNSGVNRPVVVGMKTLYNLPKVFVGEVTGKKSVMQKTAESFGIFGDFDFNILEPTTELEYEIGAKKRRFGLASNIFHMAEQFTKASDMAARLAVFEETLLDTGGVKRPDGMIEGGDMLLAQTRARELINFSRQGTSQTARVLSRVVPFFNAYAQGMDRVYRAATGLDGSSAEGRDAARNLFWKRIGIMAGMATLYALAMSDDEEYRNASDEVRDNNWLFGHGIKIPLPKELAFLFKAIPERVVDYYNRHGTPEEQEVSGLLGGIFKSAISAYSSPTAVPSVVKPLLEHMTNHSFFLQRELESASMKAQEPGERSTSSTSELAKAIGQKLNISPIVLDNYIKGFTGMAGSTMLLAADAVLNPSRPDRPLYQMPFFNIFLYDTIGGKSKTEFYDLRERVSQATTTYNNLLEKDPERAMAFYEKRAGLIEMAPIVNDAFKELNDIRKMRVFIQDASDDIVGMTGKERREMIDELRGFENDSIAHVRQLDKMVADLQNSLK